MNLYKLTTILLALSSYANAQLPTISSISSNSATPSASIIITGTNFNSTPANNIVYFGASKAATPTSASTTSLTVTIPHYATHSRISVMNTASNLAGHSQYAFYPTYTATSTTPTFATGVVASVDSNSWDIALGDIDGDGKADVICTKNRYTSRISVLRNTSNANAISFATQADFSVAGSTSDWISSVAVGDIDGDGKLDIVSTAIVNGSISILRNTSSVGSPSFASSVSYSGLSWPYRATIADINGDGKNDIIVTNEFGNNISVFRNTGSAGSISFASKVDFTTNTSPDGLVIADFDGDGKVDVATANQGNTISVLRNTSSGNTISFATKVDLTATNIPTNLSSGDIDGDGKPDIVSANYQFSTATISVFRNTGNSGTISFATRNDITVGTAPLNIAIADITGDGKVDLVSSNTGSNTLSVLRNTSSSGSVSFASKVDITTTAQPSGLAAGDLNGDGKPDVITSNYGSGQNRVTAYRNTMPEPNTWNGSTWSAGTPNQTTDVIIASNNAPASFSCRDITINNGYALNTGTSNTTTIYGNLTNNGNGVTGQGTLTFTKSGIASINGDTLEHEGTLIVKSGCTLTTNSLLRLTSDATNTGRIGESDGTISGNVYVQRYMPGKRCFRFYGHPFSSSIALSQLTDEIDITGNGGSTNGFTNTTTNNPSAFWFDVTVADTSTSGANPGWTAFTSANSADWDRYELLRLLVRGTKGQGLTGSSYSPSAATFEAVGAINQGNQVITLTKGSSSEFVGCGNPFPSPVNMQNVARGVNVGANYYVWDATSGASGAYVTNSWTLSYNLPAYSAFFTTVTANSSNTLTFEEQDKEATGAGLFKTTGPNDWVELYIYDSTTKWDRLLINLNNNGMEVEDQLDGKKLYNPNLDFFTLSKDNVRLAVDVRPYDNGKSIPLGLTAYNRYNRYAIRTGMFDIPVGTKLMLHDKYLNKQHELKTGSEYWFDVTTDTASQGNNRFEINMVGKPTSIITGPDRMSHIKLMPNPVSDEVKLVFDKVDGFAIVSILSITGQVIFSEKVSTTTGKVTVPIKHIPHGAYIIELKGRNISFTKKFVKK